MSPLAARIIERAKSVGAVRVLTARASDRLILAEPRHHANGWNRRDLVVDPTISEGPLFPPPRLSGRCGIQKRSFAGDYPGHVGFWVRLSLGTMRAAYCKKSQADAIKTLQFSAYDSVTPPDASITSHAASRGAPRPQAYLRVGLHRGPAPVDGAIVRPTVPGRRAGSDCGRIHRGNAGTARFTAN